MSIIIIIITEQAKRVHGHTVVVSEGETPSTEQAKNVVIQLCQRVRRHTKNAVALSQISTASKVT